MHRLLIFEGAPGAGKSTLSEFAAQQLDLNGIPCDWLEEHVLDGEHFRAFAAVEARDAQAAGRALLSDWERLLERARASGRVLVLDGAYFGSTLKYLLAHGAAPGEIRALAEAIAPRLMPLQPLVVHLCGDARRQLARAIAERGDNWARTIASDVNAYPCQSARNRRGVDGMIEFFADSYELFACLLETSTLPRLAMDTTAGDWPATEEQLLQALGLERKDSPPVPTVDPDRFVGTYRPPEHFPSPYNTPFAVEVIDGELRLHMVFHDNYRLAPKSDGCFQIRTKPWQLEFVLDDNGEVAAAVYPFIQKARHFCPRIAKQSVRPVLPGE